MGGWSGCCYFKCYMNLIKQALSGLLQLQIKKVTELARGSENLQCRFRSSVKKRRKTIEWQ